MKKWRDHFFVKLFWFCFSLHLLNISADTTALLNEHKNAVSNFNYQESIAEIVIEMLLGEEDFFQEVNEHSDDNSERTKPFKPLLFLSNFSQLHLDPVRSFDRRNKLNYHSFQFNSIFIGADSPPPEV
jgi:hypothetical protein